ncbi:hypothetical protein PhaeoP54_00181 [Phaeobacter inhibens]|nr:hypothetical protein PhaeoP54_00181 [Phaeobacter inhibens]
MNKNLDRNKFPVRALKDVPRERLCLRCRRPFWSEGFVERICRRCKGLSSWQTLVQSVSPPGRRR